MFRFLKLTVKSFINNANVILVSDDMEGAKEVTHDRIRAFEAESTSYTFVDNIFHTF